MSSPKRMKVLDLFSGIGGFSLGLERTGGFKTVAFCEIDPFCRKVLSKHWPDVIQYEDVRELSASQLEADGISVDVICGGFPCQDISTAGKGAGITGERSGLWSEYARLIGELRPRYAIVENVSALLGRGLGKVLGDLAEIGFDAEWHCIPAAAVGAPHRRDRLWLVSYPARDAGEFQPRERQDIRDEPAIYGAARRASNVADANGQRQSQPQGSVANERRWASDGGSQVGHAGSRRLPGHAWWGAGAQLANGCWWLTEPDVGRVAYGVPARVDRLKALGNAVVPQIPELIGRAILASTSPEPITGER